MRHLEALVRILEVRPRACAGDLQGQGEQEAGEPCCADLGQADSPWKGWSHGKGNLEAGLLACEARAPGKERWQQSDLCSRPKLQEAGCAQCLPPTTQ